MNPYEILNVEKNANESQIKKAYRDLAHKYHPDKNQGDSKSEEKFKEISSAYEILSDPKKKAEYDQYGSVGGNNHGFDINDIFSQFGFGGFGGFGGYNRQSENAQGQHIKQKIDISFMEAAHGCEKTIKINRFKECEKCNSTGAFSSADMHICSTCNGVGRTMKNSGFMRFVHTCNTCNGNGKQITKKCNKCSGIGKYPDSEKLKIKIPAGVDNGTCIRLSGKGMPGKIRPGDLYLYTMVAPHKEFMRNGMDIRTEKSISYLDAILGVSEQVNTIHGSVSLKIPPGTQPNSVLKISNKGITHENNKGHHLVSIKVLIPENISDEEKSILDGIRQKKEK